MRPRTAAALHHVHLVLAMPAPERFTHFNDAIAAFHQALATDLRQVQAEKALRPMRTAYRARRLARHRRARR